ncbi:MAG: hypothetical protein ABIH63_03955 [archaeon]
MKLYIELEEGDEIAREDHAGTFIVKKNGHCFKSIDCRLEDYKAGTKVRADYLGYMAEISNSYRLFEDLPWKKYIPSKVTSEAD